jgi:hypothetical protein
MPDVAGHAFIPQQSVAHCLDMTELIARNLFATRCQAIKELLQFIIRQRDGAQHRQQALAHDIAGCIEHMYASCMLLLRTSRRCNAVRHIFSISQIVKQRMQGCQRMQSCIDRS